MLRHLSLENFLESAKTSKRVAVYHEILADQLTPVSIFAALAEKLQNGAILESGLQQQHSGRYSFFYLDTIGQLIAKNNTIQQKIGNESQTFNANPIDALRNLMKQFSCASPQDLAGFTGGAVGFISYDAVRLFEEIPHQHADKTTMPDFFFNFYRTCLVFDHQQQKLLITIVADIKEDPAKVYEQIQKEIDHIIEQISAAPKLTKSTAKNNNSEQKVEKEISDEDFAKLVQKAKKYITEGDAFQIVLSRCFKKAYTASPFSIYRALRQVSPSPFMFYLPFADSFILGASPEQLVKVQNGQMTVHAIAGTRPRPEQSKDAEIDQELLNSEKDVAEHMMLVDLARNDVGSVCVPGSVQVPELLKIKHYSHTTHIVSEATGKLRDGLDAFDALKAAFPAGTLSGAPKIRAMEIIDELEASARGLYGGGICKIDQHGNFDSCIAIRMAVLKDGVATVRAGAGIVYDSDPMAEAQETQQKAQAMLDAIQLAEQGLL
jgi:anthranilate synthase component 1